MKFRKRILWQICAWGLAFLLCGIILNVFGNPPVMEYGLISFAFYIVVFYVNILWIMPNWNPARHITRLIAGWFALLICTTIFSFFLSHLTGVFTKNGQIGLELLNTFLRNILFVGIMLFIGITYRYIADRFTNEKIQHALETDKLKTELDFLRSQVNPHFLFNTLNNIYTLAYRRSVNTADSIMKLSEILRYMLYESSTEFVVISREIHYLKLLLSLQQLRVNGPLMLNFDIAGETEKDMIAPLILLSFVENVIKHGLLNDPLNPAMIKLCIKNGELSLYSKNKIDPAAKDSEGGIGLTNVRRRLLLLYSDKHILKTENDGTYYSVNLTLQLR